MMLLSDNQLREDVLRELRHETRLRGTKIEVTVSDYIVTLAGTVRSTGEKMTAQEAAQAVNGVFGVINSIEVIAPAETRTDAEVLEEIKHALEWDRLIPHKRIQATVTNGWVALEGKVDLLRERVDAERIVRRLAGVRGVYNELEVSTQESKPENVREAIAEGLKRRAQREAEKIEVSFKDGVVTLSGQVQSWEEERTAIIAASQAPGVQSVRDHLRINS